MLLENKSSNSDIRQKTTSEKAIKPLDLVRERSLKQSMTAGDLRSQQKFKGQLTAQELGAHNDQAQAMWQANDHAAKREGARDRGQRNSPNCNISLGHRPDRYMARGGAIEENKRLVDYLLDNEHEAFKSGKRMKSHGIKDTNLPPREKEALKLYKALSYMKDNSPKNYTAEKVKNKLDKIRSTESYKKAFEEGPSSPQNEGGSSSQEQPGSPSPYQPHYEGHQPSEHGYYYRDHDSWDAWEKRKGYPK